MTRRLDRQRDGRPAAPVRLVHLGLGSFFRAHAAWYTEHAADADAWGWWAFTGRRSVDDLIAQDGLYSLLQRGPDGDRVEVVSALSRVGVSTDLPAWLEAFALPDLAVVTTSVTEAAYCLGDGGGLDRADRAVVADVEALRTAGSAAQVSTAPGKLVLGLLHRHSLGLGGLSLVPCDNLPGNGPMLRGVLHELADRVDTELLGWIETEVGFVSTMVDRITPRTTPADRADVLATTGVDDPECVVTEPFAEWVLSGDFVAGRPDWTSSGARFVDDIEVAEQRKLWMLNGGHSLMAYAASIRGARTVADAIADPVVRGWLEEWWDDAQSLLPLPGSEVAAYRQSLVERWANPAIRHQLSQIAADGSHKVPVRVLPILRAALERSQVPRGATRVVAAWTLHLRGLGAPVTDPGAADLVGAVGGVTLPEAVGVVLDHLGIDDRATHDQVLEQARQLAGSAS